MGTAHHGSGPATAPVALAPLPCSIRELEPADQPLLWEMLYQSLFVPAGVAAPPRDIILRPDLARYVEHWGGPDDLGFAALSTRDEAIGAAQLRRLWGERRGYGYVDDETPEIGIAVLPVYRGGGIGARLLAHLLEAARGRYPAVSLSVSRGNPARRLYERLGFAVVGEDVDSLTMLRTLDG